MRAMFVARRAGTERVAASLLALAGCAHEFSPSGELDDSPGEPAVSGEPAERLQPTITADAMATGTQRVIISLREVVNFERLRYSLIGEHNHFVRSGNIDTGGGTRLEVLLAFLPVGEHYALSVVGEGENGESCSGLQSFSLAQNQDTPISLDLKCERQLQIDTLQDIEIAR